MRGVGNMLWRIGDILDFDEQLAWTREAGFDGAGFHASAGTPGQWLGIEPADCSSARRASLRRELSGFAFTEIHAPFAIELTSEDLTSGIDALSPVMELAADLGASVVTVHARLPHGNDQQHRWFSAMLRLNQQAADAQTVIGLEITDDFDSVIDWGLPSVGVTLDVGHMYDRGRAQSLLRCGGIGALIRHLGPTLVHLHVHDTDGDTDHCEVGTGIVDFAQICSALKATGYAAGATLEMNPDRTPPAGILRSAAFMRSALSEAGM